jgi:hypothetical protein
VSKSNKNPPVFTYPIYNFDSLIKDCQYRPELLCYNDEEGNNLLHLVIYSGSLKNVIDIIELRPDLLRQRNQEGHTPVHLASWMNKRPEFIEALASSDKKALLLRDVEHRTPLHLSASCGKGLAVRILIEAEPKALYAKSSQGFTPLHLASSNSNDSSVALLLQADSSEKYLGTQSADGRRASALSRSTGTQILFSWYEKDPFPFQKITFLLAKSKKEKTLLPRESADEICMHYNKFWPEDLKKLVLMSASPRVAERILSYV